VQNHQACLNILPRLFDCNLLEPQNVASLIRAASI
jgi:hypothetical protein